MSVSPEIHQRLKAWGRWARSNQNGNAPGSPLAPRCGSVESGWLPPAGNVHMSPTEALEQSLRHLPASPDEPHLEVEVIVMRLPHRQRLALRLEYVRGRGMRMQDKARELRIAVDQYLPLVEEAAHAVSIKLMMNCSYPQENSVNSMNNYT